MLRLACAIALCVTGASAFASDVERLPAESDASYICRSLLIPEARACEASCLTDHAEVEQSHARWSCTQACTVRALWAMAECRAEVASGASVSGPAARVATR